MFELINMFPTPVYVADVDIKFEDKDLEDVLIEINRIGGYRKVSERKIVKRHIECSIFNKSGYIEEPRKIAGKILPIIPFYGKRTIVDGAETY